MGPTILFIYNEIIELAKTNEVLLLTTNRIKEYEQSYPFENIKVISYAPNKVINKINWILERRNIYFNRKNLTFSKELNSLINSFNPDIIHGHFGYESMILLENLKRFPAPIFISFHGYDANEMLKRKCYVKKLNYYIDYFNITPIYVSNYMKKDMENAGIHLKNAHLLYYGTNMNYFKPSEQKKTNEKFTFLQISSVIESKGQTYTLQAFKKFLDSEKDKKYKLIIAGGGHLLEQIKNEVKNLELMDYVEFTGLITYKEVQLLLQDADAFVHHSITSSTGKKEGIPNALMEAMAMELPVISTFHAGIPELIEDGVNGYLVKEKDIDAYSKRMKDILTWGRQPKNRLKVQEIFSVDIHKKNLMHIYNEGKNNLVNS